MVARDFLLVSKAYVKCVKPMLKISVPTNLLAPFPLTECTQTAVTFLCLYGARVALQAA
jgi:hypothetical protein